MFVSRIRWNGILDTPPFHSERNRTFATEKLGISTSSTIGIGTIEDNVSCCVRESWVMMIHQCRY